MESLQSIFLTPVHFPFPMFHSNLCLLDPPLASHSWPVLDLRLDILFSLSWTKPVSICTLRCHTGVVFCPILLYGICFCCFIIANEKRIHTNSIDLQHILWLFYYHSILNFSVANFPTLRVKSWGRERHLFLSVSIPILYTYISCVWSLPILLFWTVWQSPWILDHSSFFQHWQKDVFRNLLVPAGFAF